MRSTVGPYVRAVGPELLLVCDNDWRSVAGVCQCFWTMKALMLLPGSATLKHLWGSVFHITPQHCLRTDSFHCPSLVGDPPGGCPHLDEHAQALQGACLKTINTTVPQLPWGILQL